MSSKSSKPNLPAGAQAQQLSHVPQVSITGKVTISLFPDPRTQETGGLIQVSPTTDQLAVLTAARDALDLQIKLVKKIQSGQIFAKAFKTHGQEKGGSSV